MKGERSNTDVGGVKKAKLEDMRRTGRRDACLPHSLEGCATFMASGFPVCSSHQNIVATALELPLLSGLFNAGQLSCVGLPMRRGARWDWPRFISSSLEF